MLLLLLLLLLFLLLLVIGVDVVVNSNDHHVSDAGAVAAAVAVAAAALLAAAAAANAGAGFAVIVALGADEGAAVVALNADAVVIDAAGGGVVGELNKATLLACRLVHGMWMTQVLNTCQTRTLQSAFRRRC